MKCTYSQESIQSFGGINFTDKILRNAGIYDHIDETLDNRGLTATYGYSDLFRSYLSMVLCGGECAEDITEHLTGELSKLKGFEPPSADTLLRMQKELATEKEVFVSDSGVLHEFNTNKKMNQLMLGLLLKTGQLSSKDKGHILDYDNQFIPTGKYDSKRSYKKEDGYFPGIASIGNLPVYIEGRNGNSNVKYKQDETLQKTFDVLEEGNIKIAHGRMDCGSFTKDVVSVLEANTSFFYVRAQRCANLQGIVSGIDHWQIVEIGHKEYQVASIEYAPFGREKTYRYVISREKRTNAQADLFTGDHFIYRAIMTNNREMTDLEVIHFYNDRGNSERLFDEMNNDFLWKKMPFSFLQENTVFLIMMGICRNLYHFLTEHISKRLDFIKPNFRLKKFIFRFMTVPAKWIKKGRQWVLKLFTSKEYHPLLE